MKIEVEERINSCQIKINAKGLWSGEVKVYSSDIRDAYEQAIKYADLLQNKIGVKNETQT